ncbi:MAG: conserved hypothetical rane protein [Marmoricola sp.]|jgi:hypothetical protein|nr:conserved hypothetical rane protein [Marmoricola sp.]
MEPADPHPIATAPFPDPGPVAPPSRRDRLAGPLLTAAVVGGVTVALHLRDPHSAGSWGECPWLALTGLYCPACGGLRAVNDLTNGDVLGAASSNLVFVVLVPVLVLGWLLWTRRAWTGTFTAPRSRHAGAWIAAFAVVMVVFAVARNLPFGTWLAP